jgi:DNA-directed RNA polymerase specialized sigma subunit
MDGLTERQRLACSLRFCGPGPDMPYSLIAAAMEISRPAACKLVKKGVARIRANGHDVADLREPAQTPD